MEFSPTSTPSFEQYQHNQAALGFGQSSPAQRRDWYDTWASMYYPNAFQAELLNYQNEYDKPINQMLRWQQAGLNPYNFQPSSGASGNQGASIKQSTGHQDIMQKKIGNTLSAVSSLSGAVRAAKEIYDYMNFGKDISAYNKEVAHQNSLMAYQNQLWNSYWNLGNDAVIDQQFDDNGNLISERKISESPRAKYMESSTQRIQAQISQLNSMVDVLYPSQAEANKAKAALTAYQEQILHGNNDAILNINTGNALADSILKVLAFWLKQQSLVGIGSLM